MSVPSNRINSLTSLTGELRALLGDRVSTAAAVRAHHGKDESYHAPHLPDAVTFPETTEEVAAIVEICARHKAPIIPFGTGTSLEGHVMALHGGVTVALTNMKKIKRVSAADMDVTVEAGVTRKQLNEHLRDTGLFFPIDPGADASLGGMTATRASGTNAVRYGTMRENVLALKVVLPDGRIVETAHRARKSAAGYDLTRLFVGSEGTLGIVTEVTLRLYGIPEAISAAVCPFESIAGAVDAVILTIQSGIPVARVELMDAESMAALNRYAKLAYPEKPTLLLEFHGTPTGVREQVDQFRTIASENGGGDLKWATSTEDRAKLWQARHDAAYACMAMRPGKKVWPTDVCVPISRLADCIAETKRDLDGSFLFAPVFGHVGDGNFHVTFVLDPDDAKEIAEVERLNERLVMRALAMDGTCTGEHGIGSGKMKFLVAEHGEGVQVMRAIKKAIDPDDIMNPGKVLRV
ncbi:MAG: FAD-binding protein [Alphaproteobacteria bacterium]|nr:FAD-binding protein [Alphaproteobacteria bacterium]